MAKESNRTDRLEHFLMLLTENALVGDDRAALEHLLKNDASARSRYARYMAMHAWLQWECADLPIGRDAIAPTAGEASSTVARLLHEETARAPLWQTYPGRFSLATFALTGLAWSVFFFAILPWWREPPAPVANPAGVLSTAVATVVETNQAQWAAEMRTLRSGSRLLPGQLIELRAGEAEIVFDSGARAILSGPARLQIIDRNAGDLQAGQLHAFVPPRAVGFSLATQAFTVVDLGTEFGLAVSNQGQSELRVFAGRVEARTDQQSIRLVAGEALRTSQGRLIRLAGADSTLVRRERLGRREPANIVWEQPRDLRGPADLATDGQIVAAVNLGSQETVVNGLKFTPSNLLGGTPAGFLNGHSTGDAGLDELLNEASVGGGQLTGFTLSELTPGAMYALQLVYCDGRPSSAERPMIFSAAHAQANSVRLTNNRIASGKGPFGQAVVGRFQATTDRLPLLIQTEKAQNAHLNAYLLRRVEQAPDGSSMEEDP